MPIVNDDGVHETELDSVAFTLPPELKKVYITKDDPAVKEGTDPNDDKMVITPQEYTRGQELDRFETDPTTGIGLEVNLQSLGGSSLGFESIDWSKLNQPFGSVKSTSKEDTPVVATTASPLVKITEGDIGEAINVGMGAGPASIEKAGNKLTQGFVDSYVNSFIKQPEFKKPVADPYAGMDETDKALAMIHEALFPGQALPDIYKSLKAIEYGKKFNKQVELENTPGTPEFNQKHGYTEKPLEQTPWSPETSPTYKKMMENAKKEEAAKLESLKHMSPSEAVEEYWKILTTKGDYSAGKFDHEYWKAQKDGNGHEMFSELLIKKHKENPNQQIPFEAAPDNVPPGWTYVEDDATHFIKQPKAEEMPHEMWHPGDWAKLTPDQKAYEWKKEGKLPPGEMPLKEQQANRLMAEMTELEAQYKALDERAAAAGYTTPAFRGLALKGGSEANPVHNYQKQFLYSSESPLLADMYASYLSHHPGYKVPENAFGQGASVAPVYINTSKYHVADAEGAMWSSFNSKAIKEAKKKGAPGVIIKNVFDEPNSTTNLGRPRTIYITFEEGAGTVKSRFAERFDPKDKNMLKMVPLIAAGGAAGYVSMSPDDL